MTLSCVIVFIFIAALLWLHIDEDLREEQLELQKQNKMTVYVAKDWLGIHLSPAKPTLVKSATHGLYEWQTPSITMYQAEIHKAVNEYVHANNTPKTNEVIKLEITFNFTKL